MKVVSQAMQFKHPELLYALFLLVIPLIVHLFQLRRFQTEKFTNVKYLKKAVQQTRKSSRLQKWLVLFTRMLLLASLIIAFAQPFFPKQQKFAETETVIYLDNSYSMQSKGKNGILLKRAIQDLLENLPAEGTVSFFTNSDEFKNISVQSLRNKLQNIEPSNKQYNWNNISLKASTLFTQKEETQKDFIAVSDFQKMEKTPLGIENITSYLVQLQPENLQNISLDTAFVQTKNLDENSIGIKLSGNYPAEVPIGIYNGNNLLAKKIVALNEDLEASEIFDFPTGPIQNGRITIEDKGLEFDNELYFSINEFPPVRVVVIGEENANFLKRIYTEPEFNIEVFSEKIIDYNALDKANFIVLNEVENISPALSERLINLNRQNVLMVVIPSIDSNVTSVNLFLQNIGLPTLQKKIEQERLVSRISFRHPLFETVFNDKVDNFQYPKVEKFYQMSNPATRVLSFETGEPFLLEQRNNFLFTAPLNEMNSNFLNSPLVVPTFYNFGNLSVTPDQLYFVLGGEQEITVQASLEKDEILKLSSPSTSFIPRQQSFQNSVKFFLNGLPGDPGHYQVLKDSLNLKTLSFNLNRSESIMEYSDLKASENVQVFQNIPAVFQKLESQNEVDTLWKWFVIFALIFLLTEMLILKFFK